MQVLVKVRYVELENNDWGREKNHFYEKPEFHWHAPNFECVLVRPHLFLNIFR